MGTGATNRIMALPEDAFEIEDGECGDGVRWGRTSVVRRPCRTKGVQGKRYASYTKGTLATPLTNHPCRHHDAFLVPASCTWKKSSPSLRPSLHLDPMSIVSIKTYIP